MNVGTYFSNLWVQENTNNVDDLTFGFVFSSDSSDPTSPLGSPEWNDVLLNFRIVDSNTNLFVSQSDDSGEAVETPAGSDAFLGDFRYINNTDGIAVSGLSGGTWTIIIDSVSFGNVTNWYAAGGGTASGNICTSNLADLSLTLGNEYRLTPHNNPPSGAPVSEVLPIANAGLDQTVALGAEVTLDGSMSTPEDISFSWSQPAGDPVSLSDNSSESPSFTAPGTPQTLTFALEVSNTRGTSEADTVDITVIDTNSAPVAEAGLNQEVRSGGSSFLDGSGSFDPDDDDISYDWVQLTGTLVTLSDNTAEQPVFTAPLSEGEILEFQLIVSDGSKLSEPSLVEVEVTANNAPIADAGSDITQDEGPGEIVNLSGVASSDPDGDGISFAWIQLSGPTVALLNANTASPSFEPGAVILGGAEYVFQLIVTDDYLQDQKSSVPATVTVNVLNANDPPRCDLGAPSLGSMWPPNHKMTSINIVGVTDPQDNSVAIIVLGVTQDEPINGLGDGDSSPDAFVTIGTPKDAVSLRAERGGVGNGRVYQIDFGASDGFESCVGSVQVTVPHSRKSTAVDDGQAFSSTEE